MNTSPCCPKCIGAYKDSDLDKGICRNISCPCHKSPYHSNVIEAGETIVKPQDWRESFEKRFKYRGEGTYFIDYPTYDEEEQLAGYLPGWAVPREFLEFIASEKLKSYDEGLKEGYGVGFKDHYKVGYDEGVQFGRALEETETEAPGSYKKGYEEGQRSAFGVDRAQVFQEGRAALIAELLTEWPKIIRGKDGKVFNNVKGLGRYNEALHTTRAIIESKRTTK